MHTTQTGSRKLLLILALVSITASASADWWQFRKDGRAATEGKPPRSWNLEDGKWENVAWRSEVPGKAASSPIVVGDQIVVTSSAGIDQERIYVISYDLNSGKERWRREFWATGRTRVHPTSANAAPTPASDGERIFAFYSSNDLVCLDLQGNLLWYRGLAQENPKAGNDIGMSSSPFVIGDTVVVQIENQGDSFAAGFDAKTGATRWRHKRLAEANWSSPVGALFGEDQRPLVFLQSGDGVTAHDAKTGEQVWRFEAQCDTISSPLVAGDMVFISSNGLTALKSSGSATPEVAWSSAQMAPASTSPVLYQGRIYTTNRSGVLACADAASGEQAWEKKLRLSGRFWATHAAADGHLFCFNSDGKAMVVRLGDKEGEVVFETTFADGIQASPAIVGDAIIVRTAKHLWKISQ
ncbi:MAG: PQQ-binding-like beta-propeller repeat protein [Planctomycetales bacterium]|nr:PQQ-binding-like beta-propeller repeat protein [Planctomycetales bacterium]